ncbi:unnamed protein product [Heligmosomoides polygyrus]|uniref:LITAF domain-containing protein n=1 Tax=Heligmosomoides polygyrus TaxID=6339 RepID=A0A183FAE2_HELPZ|nr:unnamed protein product [Heligmosomoides polygyrus]
MEPCCDKSANRSCEGNCCKQPAITNVQNRKKANIFEYFKRQHLHPFGCTIVVTRRLWVSGSCACTVLILSLCIPFLWPMLCFLFSPAFKDAHHHCPYCLTLLSIRRR